MAAVLHQQNVAVNGGLYYAAAAGDQRLFCYAHAPPHGAPETNVIFVEHVVAIHDAHQVEHSLCLDVEGAAVREHRSAVRSFYDEVELHRVGYPEVADLVQAVTGAAEVVVFDHNVRRGGARTGRDPANEPRRPVFHIHTDFTIQSGQARARTIVDTALTSLSHRRFAAINVWRPLVEPLRDSPLAICDASSVGPSDLLSANLLYPDRTGEIYITWRSIPPIAGTLFRTCELTRCGYSRTTIRPRTGALGLLRTRHSSIQLNASEWHHAKALS